MANNNLLVAVAVGAVAVGAIVLATRKSTGTPVKDKGTIYFILTNFPPGFNIKVDGTSVAPGQTAIDVGTHTWTATAPGYVSQSGTVNIVKGQTSTVTITFVPGGGGQITHPLFKVGDIIFPNVPGGDYAVAMKVYYADFTPSGTHTYGYYDLTWLSGPKSGGGTGWWVEDADAYFHLGNS
jgi:hypothetical protein